MKPISGRPQAVVHSAAEATPRQETQAQQPAATPAAFPAQAARFGLVQAPRAQARGFVDPAVGQLLEKLGPTQVWKRLIKQMSSSPLDANEKQRLGQLISSWPKPSRDAVLHYANGLPNDVARLAYLRALLNRRPPDPTQTLLQLLARPIAPAAREYFDAQYKDVDNAYQGVRRTSQTLAKIRQAAEGASNTLKSGYSPAKANIQRLHDKMDLWLQQRRPLSVEMIQEINYTLNEGIDMGWNRGKVGGTLRGTLPNTPVDQQDIAAGDDWSLRYAKARDVPALVADFARKYKDVPRGVHPIEHAGRAYQHLCSIHPFFDANGRTSRAVMDYILMQHGYLPSLILGEQVKVGVFAARGDNTPPEFALQSVLQGQRAALEVARGG